MGGIAGFCYAASLKYPYLFHTLKSRVPSAGKGQSRSKPRPNPQSDSLSKEDIDRILDKIGREGMGALTPREREMLKRATR